MREEELEVALKVVIVGDGGVGKSSMIQRYCRGTFTRDYKKTIGVDFLERQIESVFTFLSGIYTLHAKFISSSGPTIAKSWAAYLCELYNSNYFKFLYQPSKKYCFN